MGRICRSEKMTRLKTSFATPKPRSSCCADNPQIQLATGSTFCCRSGRKARKTCKNLSVLLYDTQTPFPFVPIDSRADIIPLRGHCFDLGFQPLRSVSFEIERHNTEVLTAKREEEEEKEEEEYSDFIRSCWQFHRAPHRAHTFRSVFARFSESKIDVPPRYHE